MIHEITIKLTPKEAQKLFLDFLREEKPEFFEPIQALCRGEDSTWLKFELPRGEASILYNADKELKEGEKDGN